jgi:hypothetical protein
MSELKVVVACFLKALESTRGDGEGLSEGQSMVYPDGSDELGRIEKLSLQTAW